MLKDIQINIRKDELNTYGSPEELFTAAFLFWNVSGRMPICFNNPSSL